MAVMVSGGDLNKLAALIRKECDALLSQWREQVRNLPSAKCLDTPTLNDHIPDLLVDLANAFEANSEQTIPEAVSEGGPPAHGRQRVKDDFDIEEVVAEYNILRGCIHDLADVNGLNLQGQPFHIINRTFDSAIGQAVQTYAVQKALEVQSRRDEYLAFIAHDLRTPLNAISMAGRVLELTLQGKERDGGTVQMLHALRRNVQQLEGMVNKVLEENKCVQAETNHKLERREFDLWALVESLVQDLLPVAGTVHTQLINNVPDDLVVYADAGLLRRVFQNLIANAIKYTPRGEIVIGACEDASKGVIECWVSDNGSGIPQESLSKIFDKGHTDSENQGGLGLGLAIVRTFIELHNGDVDVESHEGQGSMFRFSLPTKAGISDLTTKHH